MSEFKMAHHGERTVMCLTASKGSPRFLARYIHCTDKGEVGGKESTMESESNQPEKEEPQPKSQRPTLRPPAVVRRESERPEVAPSKPPEQD
jgi:hypothetical protein